MPNEPWDQHNRARRGDNVTTQLAFLMPTALPFPTSARYRSHPSRVGPFLAFSSVLLVLRHFLYDIQIRECIVPSVPLFSLQLITRLEHKAFKRATAATIACGYMRGTSCSSPSVEHQNILVAANTQKQCLGESTSEQSNRADKVSAKKGAGRHKTATAQSRGSK